ARDLPGWTRSRRCEQVPRALRALGMTLFGPKGRLHTGGALSRFVPRGDADQHSLRAPRNCIVSPGSRATLTGRLFTVGAHPPLAGTAMQRTRLCSLLAGAMAVAAYAPLASGQGLDSATVAGFRWRTIGPAIFMGRTSDVQGIASPSKTLYLAGASGGIWKSMNNGVTWRPIFDNQDVSAFGVLAISESDTNVVWAGTGGPNSRNTIEPGDGVYKSTDGGEHWTKMGLEQSQHIGRIAIDPR